MRYKQLVYEERVQIEVLIRSGRSIRSVATVLGRSPNTISRELREKEVKGIYDPKKAQQKTYARRQKSKRECMKVGRDPYLSRFVDTHIRLKWSPERMSGYLKKKGYHVSTNWRKLEDILDTDIYFTHPYSSWEKGLVENTNRWIRLFVPKSSDIALVSHSIIQDALRWLNELPRQCINFQSSGNLLLEFN